MRLKLNMFFFRLIHNRLYMLLYVTPISFFFKNDFMAFYRVKVMKIHCITNT